MKARLGPKSFLQKLFWFAYCSLNNMYENYFSYCTYNKTVFIKARSHNEVQRHSEWPIV